MVLCCLLCLVKGVRPEMNAGGPCARSPATQPLAARPCHPSQMCSGMQSLFWPGVRFTKIKETLRGGQRASASEAIKAALEAVWHSVDQGAGGMGQLGTWQEVTHPEYTRINDKRANLHTLNKTCWPARSPRPFYRSAWLSLGSAVIQCNRYALQNYLSAAQQLHKQGRKIPLEYLKSSTGSFKPLANASG